MEPINKSGFYESSPTERFLLAQEGPDSNLVSGKDCLLCYFQDPAILCQIDSVSLRIINSCGHDRLVPVSGHNLLRDEYPGIGPHIGIVIKAFMLSKSGIYSFDLACLDKSGKTISTVTLPGVSFAHDIDYWMNNWIPNGLAI